MTRTLDPSLVARNLGAMRERIVASPEFLARHAPDGVTEPVQLSQLETLRNNHFRDEGLWLLQRGGEQVQVPLQGTLAINSYIGMRRAALLGQGITRLPYYLVAEELHAGRLKEVLPDWRLPATPVSLVYPSREHLPQRARVFRDFVVAWFEAPERAQLLG
jgi:DNA-binding transcriptional LysR family regulator